MNVAPRAIHHLSCGTLCPRGARFITGEGGLLAQARMVCHCLLIEGAEGLVLVDTGFGVDDVRNPRQLGAVVNALLRPRLSDPETAVAQVRALGFDPHDVRHIIATHLDLDHAGGLPDFPHAEVHLLDGELKAALKPSWQDRARYVAEHWAHGPKWVEHATGGEQWHGFDAIRVLPGSDAEILLIPLRGHSHGHTGVAVRRGASSPQGDGWLLHCGDAFFHHGEIATPPHCPPVTALFATIDQVDAAARHGNVERLRELSLSHGEDVELICSHDPVYLEGRSPATPPSRAPGAPGAASL